MAVFNHRYKRYRLRNPHSFNRNTEHSNYSGNPQKYDSSRDGSNYRKSYFEKNRGLSIRLYMCAYCFKMFGHASQMHADHIFARSRWPRWLLRVADSSFNIVMACPDCNLAKSNRTGLWLLRGMAGKIVFTAVEGAFSLASFTVKTAWNTARFAVAAPFKILGWAWRRRRRSWGGYHNRRFRRYTYN